MATRLLFIAFLSFCISGVASGGGTVQEIGGLKTYVSGSTQTKRSVILISDVFGSENPRLRMIADKVAAAGFYSLVPDFFNGDPYIEGRNFTDWFNKHKPEEGYKIAGPLIDVVRSKGVTKFGAAGFCWGGKVVIDLLNHDQVEVDVLLHPTYVNVTDIKKVSSPIMILGGENDNLTRPAVIKEFEDVLKTKPKVNSFVRIFPKVAHGWTIHYNDTDKEAVRSAEEAHKDILSWFLKHLI